jgi:hypothetical protein
LQFMLFEFSSTWFSYTHAAPSPVSILFSCKNVSSLNLNTCVSFNIYIYIYRKGKDHTSWFYLLGITRTGLNVYTAGITFFSLPSRSF